MDYHGHQKILDERVTASDISGLGAMILGIIEGTNLHLRLDSGFSSIRKEGESSLVEATPQNLDEALDTMAGLYRYTESAAYTPIADGYPIVYLPRIEIIPNGEANPDTVYTIDEFTDVQTPFSGYRVNRNTLKRELYDGVLRRLGNSVIGRLVPDSWKAAMKKSIHTLDKRLSELAQERFQVTLVTYTSVPTEDRKLAV